jgi:hypothetical protein
MVSSTPASSSSVSADESPLTPLPHGSAYQIHRGISHVGEKEVCNMASTTTWGEADRGYDMSLWYDSRPLKIGWFAILFAVGFLSYEIISRRKPSDKFLENAQKVGMLFLLALMVFIFANDIIKLF